MAAAHLHREHRQEAQCKSPLKIALTYLPNITQYELSLARQQSRDIDRAKRCLEGLTDEGMKSDEKEDRHSPERDFKRSPSQFYDSKRFSDPPAPPPQQPLPEKPDVARALADPVIQPLLRRADTARPNSWAGGSPTRADHSEALLVLTRELKMAKDQIPSLEDRVRLLEQQLSSERNAREVAEERASQLEVGARKDSAHPSREGSEYGESLADPYGTSTAPDLRAQLDRMNALMHDMKQLMESYRRRADSAEQDRDSARKSLADMVEEKRRVLNGSGSPDDRTKDMRSPDHQENKTSLRPANGHAVGPAATATIFLPTLLARAGLNTTEPLTKQQALTLQRLLGQETVKSDVGGGRTSTSQLPYHGVPHACALTTVVLGLALMHYLNGWEKVQR